VLYELVVCESLDDSFDAFYRIKLLFSSLYNKTLKKF
jgi:hypothetical protein